MSCSKRSLLKKKKIDIENLSFRLYICAGGILGSTLLNKHILLNRQAGGVLQLNKNLIVNLSDVL